MPTPTPLPPRDLPPASVATLGCLFLPGCLGNFVVALLALMVIIQACVITACLVEGKPIVWTPMQIGGSAPGWLLLSAFVCHSLRSRNRRPWVYWMTVICLLGWCYLAAHASMKVNYPGATEADALRIGAWVASVPVVLMLLWFALSRRNHAYFGLTKGTAAK